MGKKLQVSSSPWLMIVRKGRVLHEGLFMPVLLNSREIMIWREKYRSRIIRAVQMDNLRGLLGEDWKKEEWRKKQTKILKKSWR